MSPSLLVSWQKPPVDVQPRTAEWGALDQLLTWASEAPHSAGPNGTGSPPGSVSVPVAAKAVPATAKRPWLLPSSWRSMNENSSAASRLATMCASPEGRSGIVTSALVGPKIAVTGRASSRHHTSSDSNGSPAQTSTKPSMPYSSESLA